MWKCEKCSTRNFDDASACYKCKHEISDLERTALIGAYDTQIKERAAAEAAAEKEKGERQKAAQERRDSEPSTPDEQGGLDILPDLVTGFCFATVFLIIGLTTSEMKSGEFTFAESLFQSVGTFMYKIVSGEALLPFLGLWGIVTFISHRRRTNRPS